MAVSVFTNRDELAPQSGPSLVGSSELSAIRAQAGLVRSLLDELEELDAMVRSNRSAQTADALAAQAIEELAQLGQRMLEAAVTMAPQRIADLRLDRQILAALAGRGPTPEH